MVYKQLFLILIFSMFFLQALVPAGFMPSIGRDGKIAIVICSIDGDKTVYVDADLALFKNNENHKPSDHRVSKCPYAVLAFLGGIMPSVEVFQKASLLIGADIYEAHVSIWSNSLIASYYSRAPPLFILT